MPRQTRHVSSPMPGALAGPSSPAFGGVAGSGVADGFVVDIAGSFRVGCDDGEHRACLAGGARDDGFPRVRENELAYT
ncbi:hypothetical protein WT24_27805 [Burkholderia sp. MSMB1078WGS]|nr:hypothetical protein WT24_27805 [Burkholderia sp. MSMB1078WGS]